MPARRRRLGSCASPTSYGGLAEGAHVFEVRAVDGVGNADPTPATHAWTVDLTPPQTTITGGVATPTSATSASIPFAASEAGSTFECRLDTAAWTPCSSPEAYAGVAEGPHTFEVRATDAAGNTDPTPASVGWVVDTSVPETAITSAPTDPTSATSATFSFISTESGSTFECRLDSGAWASCGSPRSLTGLSEGPHTFAVRATDPAGNTDPDACHAYVGCRPDRAGDQHHVDAGGSVQIHRGRVHAVLERAGVDLRMPARRRGLEQLHEPNGACGPLGGQPHLRRPGGGSAGNVDPSPASFSWVVDQTSPETSIGSAPADPTNATSASFSFTASEPGSTFECALGGAGWAPCASPHDYSDLADGAHTFEVRATDAAGNVDQSPAARAWTVDTLPPASPTIESPAAGTTSATGTVTVSGTAEPGAVVELFEGATSRGTATTGPGGLWSRTLTGLSDGSHSYTATARDAAGNTSGASNSRTVVVDTTAPNTVLTTGPLGATSSTSASFTFAADDPSASFECRLDGSAWTACSSPRTYATLTEGSHTFEVRATDVAGNTDQTPALRTWTVDTTPPASPAITSPEEGATISSGTLTISGTAEPGSIVELFDGVASKGVTATSLGGSWSKVVSGLADGSHAFTAMSTDAAGNASGLSSARTVAVDTTIPDTSIETGPSNPTAATDATFEFAANEPGATFQCRLDGGAWATCTSPETRGALAEGAHTFEVRAIDAAGNTDASPAVWTWSVDLTAPDTNVDSGPADPTAETQADFIFSTDDPSATFECILDGGGWAPCSSPEALTGLAAGTHTFEVRAVDPAGNVDPTPATHSWTVT